MKVQEHYYKYLNSKSMSFKTFNVNSTPIELIHLLTEITNTVRSCLLKKEITLDDVQDVQKNISFYTFILNAILEKYESALDSNSPFIQQYKDFLKIKENGTIDYLSFKNARKPVVLNIMWFSDKENTILNHESLDHVDSKFFDWQYINKHYKHFVLKSGISNQRFMCYPLDYFLCLYKDIDLNIDIEKLFESSRFFEVFNNLKLLEKKHFLFNSLNNKSRFKHSIIDHILKKSLPENDYLMYNQLTDTQHNADIFLTVNEKKKMELIDMDIEFNE